MTGLQRTISFIRGDNVDHPPFHPIIMRWAAAYAGVTYRDFCTIPEAKCMAMIKCSKDFNIDWVTVLSDPWAEASAFGIEVDYPENDLPLDKGGHLPDAAAAAHLMKYNPFENTRCRNRLKEIDIFKKELNEELLIVGWVEGPVAEYVDLRKESEAAMDLCLDPENAGKAMDLIVEAAKDFITLQIKAGAHCIGIGDAFCSQIGPELYKKFAFRRQKEMVDHIHKNGALAKLHICGNTNSILELMIDTGADIVDVDHMVPSMEVFYGRLSPGQVFSGKSDPVTVIQDGSPDTIRKSVGQDFRTTNGRCIVSAGCEITPGTSIGNMKAFMNSAFDLQRMI
jgi:uroporphyrinogen decarboxylase